MTEVHLRKLEGARAVVGIDMVGFTKLRDEDQLTAIQRLITWVRQSLAYYGIGDQDYRWSPAGDGGYLTFDSTPACKAAIDVAITICQKGKEESWRPLTGDQIQLKVAVHAGTVAESSELGRESNIWGEGINTAERILGICAPSQILVSQPFHDLFIKGRRDITFSLGELHWRTVKHEVQVAVMNVNRHGVGLDDRAASSSRWQAIGDLWRRTIQEFRFLIRDSLKSGEAVPALAASKFLLNLEDRDMVLQLCSMIGRSEKRPWEGYPAQDYFLFGQMPAEILFKVVEQATPRLFMKDEVICEEGEPAHSCFFPVSGTVAVEANGLDHGITISQGQIIGEFALWVPNIKRTARLRALQDGLFLEIENQGFAKVLDDSPEEVASEIFGVIKRRITENILSSASLFPGLQDELKRAKSKPSITCRKDAAGAELDLTASAYVLFSGEVRIEPKAGSPIVIQAPGRFGLEKVVGILCEVGQPDGTSAKVLTDTVSVQIPHRVLRQWQDDVAGIRDAWEGIYGSRLGEIKRAAGSRRKVQQASVAGVGQQTIAAPAPAERLSPAPAGQPASAPPQTVRAPRSQEKATTQLSNPPEAKKHIFLSCCHECARDVASLRRALIAAGERVWWDGDIPAGGDWKFEIQKAMKAAYAVLLCLSQESQSRITTGIYPEALEALEEFRKHRPGNIFLIPVRLSNCEIPPLEIDGLRKLDRLQYVDYFPPRKRPAALKRLIDAVRASPSRFRPDGRVE
jgi:CRP-like cAMP-binding protein/class 3 adenylate cyclase